MTSEQSSAYPLSTKIFAYIFTDTFTQMSGKQQKFVRIGLLPWRSAPSVWFIIQSQILQEHSKFTTWHFSWKCGNTVSFTVKKMKWVIFGAQSSGTHESNKLININKWACRHRTMRISYTCINVFNSAVHFVQSAPQMVWPHGMTVAGTVTSSPDPCYCSSSYNMSSSAHQSSATRATSSVVIRTCSMAEKPKMFSTKI